VAQEISFSIDSKRGGDCQDAEIRLANCLLNAYLVRAENRGILIPARGHGSPSQTPTANLRRDFFIPQLSFRALLGTLQSNSNILRSPGREAQDLGKLTASDAMTIIR